MDCVLDYINGEPSTRREVAGISKAYENLKTFINKQLQQDFSDASTPALDTAETTTVDEIECERCGLLLEDQARITLRCDCTRCAECVEESFEAIEFDPDMPLKTLSKGYAFAQKLTVREILTDVEHLLSKKSYKHAKKIIVLRDTISSLDLDKNDWTFDEDEVDECSEEKSLPDMSTNKRKSW